MKDFQIVGDEEPVSMCTKQFIENRDLGPDLKKFVRNIEIDDVVGNHHKHHGG